MLIYGDGSRLIMNQGYQDRCGVPTVWRQVGLPVLELVAVVPEIAVILPALVPPILLWMILAHVDSLALS